MTTDDPFPSVPGMVTVTLELDGSLRSFAAVPPERDSASSTSTPDWAAFFKLANLDVNKFQKAAPEWVPLAAVDARAAWTGTFPSSNNIPIRVEAAALQGRPVYFTIVWPWTKPAHTKPNPASMLSSIVSNGFTIFWWMVNIGAIWVARLNLKAGRGDARGAFRVGMAIGVARLLMWALEAHHVHITSEEGLFNYGLGLAVLEGVRFWVFYLALEPWVRRYWPQALLTWARVIAGKVRDPLVGRDILYAVLFGTLYSLFILAYDFWDMRSGAGTHLTAFPCKC